MWTEILDQGGTLDIIYCDFMKAFDKVPHWRLIHRIKNFRPTNIDYISITFGPVKICVGDSDWLKSLIAASP